MSFPWISLTARVLFLYFEEVMARKRNKAAFAIRLISEKVEIVLIGSGQHLFYKVFYCWSGTLVRHFC
jgi:hypothetical protein